MGTSKKQMIISKLLCVILIFLYSSINVLGQIYTGPIPKPTGGYGSEGNFTVATQSFANPNFPAQNIIIYYPSGIISNVPTLFYSHGYGGNNPSYNIGLFNFFAKKGYAIVFVPYQTLGVSNDDRYTNLIEGFRKAARDFPNIIDTTRVGFIGHSFGGGATITISYKCFSENNWGQNGRFIAPSAPWYSLNITQSQLQSFPADTKMLTFIYDADSVNDHRMACEIFNNINIAGSEKDFIKVLPSTVSGYNYTAGHDLPSTNAAFDAMDYYAYYRLLDALCDYTFNGNINAKNTALGNGSVNQVSMPGGMANLSETDTPNATYPESNYSFPCSSSLNPRQAYCNNITSSLDTIIENERISIFPNPSEDLITVKSYENILSIEVINIQGQVVKSINESSKPATLSIGNLPKGLYFMKVNFKSGGLWTTRLVKK